MMRAVVMRRGRNAAAEEMARKLAAAGELERRRAESRQFGAENAQ